MSVNQSRYACSQNAAQTRTCPWRTILDGQSSNKQRSACSNHSPIAPTQPDESSNLCKACACSARLRPVPVPRNHAQADTLKPRPWDRLRSHPPAWETKFQWEVSATHPKSASKACSSRKRLYLPAQRRRIGPHVDRVADNHGRRDGPRLLKPAATAGSATNIGQLGMT